MVFIIFVRDLEYYFFLSYQFRIKPKIQVKFLIGFRIWNILGVVYYVSY